MARIVFMGSPDFATPSLRALVDHYQIVGVVTQPDRPFGREHTLRPPAVKPLALQLGLPLLQPEKLSSAEALDQLRAWAPDLIVVVAFGQILRSVVLSLPPNGCVNVHASLLPRWRGAAPIQAALLAGDVETGISIMKMDQAVDTGPILAQSAIPIAADDTSESLFEKLSLLAAEVLLETLPPYLSGELKPRKQEDGKASYAPMLKREDGELEFTKSAEELARHVRALNPWPGAFFKWDRGVLNILRAHVESGSAPSGHRLVHRGKPAIGAQGGLLVLDEVQPAGRKPMSGKALLAGARGWEQ
jgi:methionyl-tRNA formyltransferase